MAREHARILCSIWRPGDDFRELGPDEQRLYFLIISQREINNAGVIPLMVSKWARCSAGTTIDDVEKALVGLEHARYVAIDRDTDEVLVRTFIRNDGIAKVPNILKSALRQAEQIESQKLRDALAVELLRLDHRVARATAESIAPDVVANSSPNPSVNRSANPSGNGSSDLRNNPSANSSPEPQTNSSPSPAGRGGEGGRGKVLSVDGLEGGTRTRATPPPAPPNLDPDNPRCGRHRDIPATDPGPGCHACRAVREQVASSALGSVDAGLTARRAWRAAVDACDECDEQGRLENPDGTPGERHHPHPEDPS